MSPPGSGLGPGLRNLGNTCYINASLQALLTLTSFINDICGDPEGMLVTMIESVNERSFYKAFVDFCKGMNKSRSGVVSPSDLKELIGATNARFLGYNQEDAHEFLLTVLNTLDEERAKLDDAEDKKSVTHKYFAFSLEHTLCCKVCNHQRVFMEDYLDMSVELGGVSEDQEEEGGSRNLLSVLRHFLRREEDVEWKCPTEDCGANTASMEHRLSRLPQVLLLHLKRFVYNEATDVFEKCKVPVEIPLRLDLAELLTPNAPPVAAGVSTSFIVRAVVMHLGPTIRSGHYVCHVRNKDQTWTKYNDSLVAKSNVSDSLNGPDAARNAYLLFYERE